MLIIIHPAGHGYYFGFPESPFIAGYLQVHCFKCLSYIWCGGLIA